MEVFVPVNLVAGEYVIVAQVESRESHEINMRLL
jgi:hypothetical protein